MVLGHGFWYHALYDNEYFKLPNPEKIYKTSSGSPLCRIWNPFHLRPVGLQMLPDLEHGRSQITAHFYRLTQALCATEKQIASFQMPDYGDGGALPHQALTTSTLAYGDFRHLMTAYSGLRCLDIEVAIDSLDRHNALTVLPNLLAQTYGLRRLSLHFVREDFQRPLHKYHYDEIFPAFCPWPELTELSLSGLAIGGWDLFLLILGRARLRQLELENMDLLSGTWEGVIEGIRRRPGTTWLTMNGKFEHCGGARFRPCGPGSTHTDSKLLRNIEDYVVHGGRHPCLTPQCDSRTAIRWFQDLTSEEELEKLKVFARQNGHQSLLYGKDLYPE